MMPRTKRKLVQHNHQIGYWRGGKQGEAKKFEALTNFGMQLMKFIANPPGLPDSYKGYLVRVTQARRKGGIREGTCFLPWYKVPGVDKLVEILGSALPTSVLQCSLSAKELRQFLLDLWHEMEQEDVDSDDSNESRVQDRQSLPVHCIGRQHGSDVFVLGPNLQFWKTGEAVPPECQQYIWIPYVLKKLDVLPSASPLTSLPEVRHPLRKVVKGLRRISGENFGSSLLVLGAAVESLFYEAIQRRCGSVAVPIAYGPASGGKTNAVKIALAACGNTHNALVAYLSESSARKKLGSSLPFAYDDPSSTEEKFKRMLITAFGGASQENCHGNISPRCVPLVTANVFIIDALTDDDPRYLMRIVLIPHASSTAAIELDFLQALHENAVSAFPQILKIGSSLEDLDASDLYRIRDDVYQAVGCQFDSRLATHYAFLLASTMKIVSRARVSGVSVETVMEHFREVVAPEIRARQINNSHQCTLGQLVDKVVACLSADKMYRILRVLNPGIRFKPNKDSRRNTEGVAIILKEFLLLLDKYDIEHEDESVIRKGLRARKDTVTTSKQYFLTKKSRQTAIIRDEARCVSCICIPRHLLSQQALQAIANSGTDKSQDDAPPMDTLEPEDCATRWVHTPHGSGDHETDLESVDDNNDCKFEDSGYISPLTEEDIRSGPLHMEESEPALESVKTVDLAVSFSKLPEIKTPPRQRKLISLGISPLRYRCMSPLSADVNVNDGESALQCRVALGSQPGPNGKGTVYRENMLPPLKTPPKHKNLTALGISPLRYRLGRSRRHFRTNCPIRRLVFTSLNSEGFLKQVQVRTRGHPKQGKRLTQTFKAIPNKTNCDGSKLSCQEKTCNHPRAKNWLQCEKCEKWFHCICVGTSLAQAAAINFFCDDCS